MSKDIVISSPVRSAIASFGGSLKTTATAAVGAHAISPPRCAAPGSTRPGWILS
jgi:hypothetical protein